MQTASKLSEPMMVTVNEGNQAWEYDQVNLICPRGVGEEHVIYSVDREEFEGCRVRGPRAWPAPPPLLRAPRGELRAGQRGVAS